MKDVKVFSRAQMGRLGFTDATLRTAIRQGRVRRLRQGWFAFDDADPTVVSAVKAGGVLGCVSALTLSGLWVPPGYSSVHVRRSKALRGAGKRAGCTTPVGRAPATPTAVDPVEYALACAASCMTAEDWIAVCDSYLNATATSVDDLRFRLEPFTGYRLAGLLEKVDERSQSGTESIMRVRLRAIGFDVVVQPGIAEYEWADMRIGRLLLECDGRQYHETKNQYAKDRKRDRRSLRDGWMSMRFIYDDVIFGWADTLADIRGVTDDDRHRVRSVRSRRVVDRSLRRDEL